MRYGFGPRLTPASWEVALGSGPLGKSGEWLLETRASELELDLSRVEFADFAALARLLLLVDSAVGTGIRSTIHLPAVKPSPEETARLEDLGSRDRGLSAKFEQHLARQTLRRVNARAFMRHVGFIAALRPPHWPSGLVTVNDGVARPGEPGDEMPARTVDRWEEDSDTPYRLGNIFPLRWLAPMRGDELRRSELFLAVIAGFRNRVGLAAPDARALGHAVLTELVENVAEHAARSQDDRPPMALVGAVLLDPLTYKTRRRDQPDQLRDLADWVSGKSAVLRVIVGDAGIGLATRLGEVRAGLHETSGVHIPNRALTPEEDTIFYAFDRWSTSGQNNAGFTRGTRGLWRVERLVRSYRGSVTVRTGNSYAGRLLTSDPRGKPVVADNLCHAPGTLLEISILPDSSIKDPIPLPGSPQTELEEPTLVCVHCGLNGSLGLTPKEQNRVDAAAKNAHNSQEVLGLVVTVATRQGRQQLDHQGLLDVLDAASRISNPSVPIAVVLPDADPRLLDLAVADMTSALERDGTPVWDSPYAPVLLIDSHGGASWCGAPRQFLRLLTEITRRGGSIQVAEAEALYKSFGEEAESLWRIIQDQHQLLSVHADRLRLRITVAGVLRALHLETGAELRRQIDRGDEARGVQCGLFRTPNLRLTNRWIDVARLTTTTVGEALPPFLLARLLERELAKSGEKSNHWTVVDASGVRSRLAGDLSENLRLDGTYHQLSGELDVDSRADRDRLEKGHQVVILCDLISTENSARRAVAFVVGQGAEPVAILSVIDARERNEPLQQMNRTIPVFSLVRSNLAAPMARGALRDIDPILRCPLDESQETVSLTDYEEDTFLEWCANVDGAIRLGHIQGVSDAHFSAYPNVDRLLSDATVSEYFLSAVADAAGDLDKDLPVSIWHPQPVDSYAGQLATLLAGHLSTAGFEVTSTEAIPRARIGARWVYPSSFQPSRGPAQVLVLDWGAMTATTMQQLIRLAADAGAERIVAVVAISELSVEDAMALTMVCQVSGARARTAERSGDGVEPRKRGSRGRAVPVSIRFVTATSVEGFSAHSCPVCLTRARYQSDDSGLPRRLRRHADLVVGQLRLRKRDDRTGIGTDLLGVAVEGAEAADYLRWRSLLRQALRNTAARSLLIGRVGEAARERGVAPWSGSVLIRLLAAEQHWMKLPPLRFTEGRELLRDVCFESLRTSSASTLSEWVRLQALMVLGVTTPSGLVDQLPDLFQVCSQQPLLADELLLQCYHLLRRPPHDLPFDSSNLHAKLEHLRDDIEGLGGTSALRAEYLPVVEGLQLLSRRHVHRLPGSIQEAWARLREDLVPRVDQHNLDAAWSNVIGLLEDLPELNPSQSTRRERRREIVKCSNNLIDILSHRLSTLRWIFASGHYLDELGPVEQRRLVCLCDSDINEVLETLLRDIEELWNSDMASRGPEWRRLHRNVLARMRWWQRFFIATHRDGGEERAHVVEFARALPTRLDETLLDPVPRRRDSTTVRVLDSGMGVDVFCPQGLVREAVGHIVENASSRHRLRDQECVIEIVCEPADDEHVVVRVRNSGSKPRLESGRGLRSIAAKLEPFGASIDGGMVGDSVWTWEARLSLELWQGGR